MTRRQSSDRGAGAVVTGQVKTNPSNLPALWASQRTAPREAIDMALAAIGFAIDMRAVVRRLDELLGGAA